MHKGLLIAGKDFPDCSAFTDTALKYGYSIMLSVSGLRQEHILPDTVHAFVWQHYSPLSARAFVLEAETALSALTHALLIFDTAFYAKTFDADFRRQGGTQTLGYGIDRLISSYIHLTYELIERFTKLGGGTLCFAVKSYPGESEYAKMNPRLKEGVKPASPLVSAASEAFKSFAENTAFAYAASPVQFLFLEYAPAAGMTGEEETADYLFSLPEMDSPKDIKNGKPLHRFRVGTKFPAVMNIFNR